MNVFLVWTEIDTQYGKQRQIVSPRYRTRAEADAYVAKHSEEGLTLGITEVTLDNARVHAYGFLHGHPTDDTIDRRIVKSVPYHDFARYHRHRITNAWHALLPYVHAQYWDYVSSIPVRTAVVRWGAHQLAMAWHAANTTGPFDGVAEADRLRAIDHILEWTTGKDGEKGPNAWRRIWLPKHARNRTSFHTLSIVTGSIVSDTLAAGTTPTARTPDGNGATFSDFSKDVPWLNV